MSSNNNIENQDEDLTGQAPHLSKVNNSSPFKANEDYFESFTTKLQNEIDDYEEIKTEAPTLATISKYNPFEVPKDYFEYFPTIIQQRVINTKQTTSVIEWLLLLIKPRFAVPFLATIFIASAGINFMNNNAEVPQIEIAEEMTTEQQLYNIDEGTIIETLYAREDNESDNTSSDESSIQNYLMDNNIDESNLNNQL